MLIIYGLQFKNNKGEWDDKILNVLFAFHIVCIFAFTLPLYLQRLKDDTRVKIVKLAPFYLLLMHIICDVAIITALYWAENFIDLWIFIFAVFFKIVVFSIQVWAAVTTMSAPFDLVPLEIWEYSSAQVNDN